MRVLWLQADEKVLEERRRHGLDGKDEVWDGVLHVVPPPSLIHERVANELLVALMPIGKRLGLVVSTGGLFEHVDSYRVPDLIVGRKDQISDRGYERAELVVEVLSPNDESREKFPFFAARKVREVWLVEPQSRAIEMYLLWGAQYVRQQPPLVSPVLGVSIEQRDGQLVIGDAVI